MKRWKVICVMTAGVLYLLACEEQAKQAPIELNDRSPVSGVWYLQAVGQAQPVAIDVTVSFDFAEQGAAAYERTIAGVEESEQHALVYNLSGEIISIDSNSEDPGIPRITGRIELDDDGQTLRILTHSDEQWLLTREALPGGEIEAAREIRPVKARVDPTLIRVQQLAYACGSYADRHGASPEHLLDLVDAGFVTAAALTPTGHAAELSPRYERMTRDERRGWLDGHSAFVLFGTHASSADASSIVVSTLPKNGMSKVFIGRANGAVQQKPAIEVARLLQKQEGALPDRWPGSAWTPEAAAGLEPLSD